MPDWYVKLRCPRAYQHVPEQMTIEIGNPGWLATSIVSDVSQTAR